MKKFFLIYFWQTGPPENLLEALWPFQGPPQGVPTQWDLVKWDQELPMEHPGHFTVAESWRGCEGGANPMSPPFVGKPVRKIF
jgi:hypothetical protein